MNIIEFPDYGWTICEKDFHPTHCFSISASKKPSSVRLICVLITDDFITDLISSLDLSQDRPEAAVKEKVW